MEKIDVEKLIHEIEKRPCEWNMRSADYSNRTIKRQNWDNLCSVPTQ